MLILCEINDVITEASDLHYTFYIDQELVSL